MSTQKPLRPEELIGCTIADRYQIESAIGDGGMATVYRATQVHLRRPVALKVLKSRYCSDPDSVERFVREARAASAIRSAHVVDILDVGEITGTTVYIAMELLQGPTLERLIESDGKIPWPRARHLALQIVRGLRAVHEHNIVHRDMKPSNCIITRNERGEEHVKILDFGIAKLTLGAADHVLTQTGAIFGTAKYMSPEQARGLKVDARTDIYAFGVILFEMLSGRVPFDGDNFPHVATQHVKDDPPSLSHLTLAAGAEALVRRCLAKRPEDRFESMKDLEQALESLRPEVVAPRASRNRCVPEGTLVLQDGGLPSSYTKKTSGEPVLSLSSRPSPGPQASRHPQRQVPPQSSASAQRHHRAPKSASQPEKTVVIGGAAREQSPAATPPPPAAAPSALPPTSAPLPAPPTARPPSSPPPGPPPAAPASLASTLDGTTKKKRGIRGLLVPLAVSGGVFLCVCYLAWWSFQPSQEDLLEQAQELAAAGVVSPEQQKALAKAQAVAMQAAQGMDAEDLQAQMKAAAEAQKKALEAAQAMGQGDAEKQMEAIAAAQKQALEAAKAMGQGDMKAQMKAAAEAQKKALEAAKAMGQGDAEGSMAAMAAAQKQALEAAKAAGNLPQGHIDSQMEAVAAAQRKALTLAKGMDPDAVQAQMAAIAEAQAKALDAIKNNPALDESAKAAALAQAKAFQEAQESQAKAARDEPQEPAAAAPEQGAVQGSEAEQESEAAAEPTPGENAKEEQAPSAKEEQDNAATEKEEPEQAAPAEREKTKKNKSRRSKSRKRRGKRGRSTHRSPDKLHELSSDDIRQALLPVRRQVNRKCGDPGLRVDVWVELQVQPNGRLSAARAIPPFNRSEIGACVERHVRMARFPQRDRSMPTKLRERFQLGPSSR